MISSIHIQGYRGFEHFDMSALGRVNLLVGTNNSGKTSVLEALYLLSSRGDPTALWNLLWRRGERLISERSPRHQEPELDVSHLFHGHEVHVGSKFVLSARNQTPERLVSFAIAEMTPEKRELGAGENLVHTRLVMQIKSSHSSTPANLPLTRFGGIVSDVLESAPRRITRGRHPLEESPATQFITTESLSGDQLVTMWNKIALTPHEELVLRALRFLDPDIERIAAQSTPQYFGIPDRSGFIIKRKGREHPIPIGSMGDGMWRMLAMAIAVTQCSGGILLVDEIDTGLHYGVMGDMWRLIFSAASEFDVQVFATTHSSDCIKSLSRLCVSDPSFAPAVTLQRIESRRKKSVPYSPDEIRVATERNIEVR